MQNGEIIETDRLILRHWKEDDAEDLFRYASDERVSELALWQVHESVEMSKEVINQYFIPNPDCLAIVLKETGETIGCIGLVPSGEEHHKLGLSEREVGYWIGYPYWNKGLTTEALNALVSHCRESLKLYSLAITADISNIGSIRVAEKCGFSFVENYCIDGINSTFYRLIL